MKIQPRNVGNVVILDVIGEIEQDPSPLDRQLEAVLPLVEGDRLAIVINLSDVTQIGAITQLFLYTAHVRVAVAGGRVVFLDTQGRLEGMLDALGATSPMQGFRDETMAVAAASGDR